MASRDTRAPSVLPDGKSAAGGGQVPEVQRSAGRLALLGLGYHSTRTEFLPFAQSEDLDVKTLAKLGAGTEPSSSWIVVTTEKELVRIHGLAAHAKPKFRDFSRITRLSVQGPGHLRLMRDARTAVITPVGVKIERDFDGLTQHVPPSIVQCVADRFSRSGNNGNVYVAGQEYVPVGPPRPRQVIPELHSEIASRAHGYIMGGLLEVVDSLESLGLGGSIVLASNEALGCAADLFSAGIIFGSEMREATGSGWTSPLLVALALEAIEHLATRDDPAFEPHEKLGPRKLDALRIWDVRQPALAALASADGVLVLADELLPVAFKRNIERVGSEFTAPVSGFLKGKGARHRSLAHAAQRLGTEALALAVSHDGGLTLFRADPESTHVTRWVA